MEEQNKTVIYQTEDGKTQIDVKFENEMVRLTRQQLPDFVNAPPKSDGGQVLVEEGLDGSLIFGQKESLGESGAVFWQLYPDGCDGSCRLDDPVYAHADLHEVGYPLEFLVNFVGHEADAHMCLDSPFGEVEHGPHLEVSF